MTQIYVPEKYVELIEERERMIEALTKVTASQHDEIVRCHDRINELQSYCNEFEQRARNAERQLKAPEELTKLTEAGQELYCALIAVDPKDRTSGLVEAIDEYVTASNTYYDRLSKPA